MEVEPAFSIVNDGRDEVPANVDFSAEELLSRPKKLKPSEVPEKYVATRVNHDVHARLDDFASPSTLHADQYHYIYSERTKRIKPAIKERIRQGFASQGSQAEDMVVDKILHTKMGQKCILIGCIVKDMPLKPNVLKQYSDERSIGPVPPRQNFVSDKDALILEDDTGRIKLVGISADVSHFVSGVVVGVSGVQTEDGDFEVSEIIVAGFAPQAPIKRMDNPRYLAIVSGLNVGGSHQNPVATQLFADYLGGLVGSPTEQSEFVSSIARLIIAGNSFCREDEQPQPTKLRDPNKKLTREEQSKVVVSIQLLDTMIKDLSHDIPIDVMPGPSDPADYSMPQQPINKFLLPHSAGQKTVNLVTNPYRCLIDGIHVLGTSGQPTDNMAMFMKVEGSTLDLMERTLQWRHIAPTAPDTLSAFPFKTGDPFIVEQCPHIYFAGNQDSYDSRLVKGQDGQIVRLIAVPDFSKSHTFVLVNMDTLNCHPITIETYSDGLVE